MNTHFSFIGINGNAGETFSSVLKDKCNNDIRFISFINVSDSPFSFPIGYAKSLQTNFIDSKNIFELKIDDIGLDQVIYYKNGDTLTIQHKPSNEYPNNIFITNDRTGTILGTLELSLAKNLIEKYGRKCVFKGEISEVVPTDNEKFKCTIKILKQLT